MENSGIIENLGYKTPQAAIELSKPEKLAYVACLPGADASKPSFLAVVDVDPESSTYCKVINEVDMPNIGDELHHMGWNACSSSCAAATDGCHECEGEGEAEAPKRRYLIVPGLKSSRIHIFDTLPDRKQPKLVQTIEPEVLKQQYDLTAPHTIHCAPGNRVLISMLGNRYGDLPGGFLELAKNGPDAESKEPFRIIGRWERTRPAANFMNYDFQYNPRQNLFVSSEWAAPNTFIKGFDPKEVANGLYGHRLHIWDWQKRSETKVIELGADGQIPLEVRLFHSPESRGGFVGCTLSSTIYYIFEKQGEWFADKVLSVQPKQLVEAGPAQPALISDILLSMDDRYLFISCWLHGEVRMYDVSDPRNPRLVSTLKVGGNSGVSNAIPGRRDATAGPQMLQLSLDGKRLYFTTSLFSSWDDQFYPDEARRGSCMFKANVDPRAGTMKLDQNFLVDFGSLTRGPSRAHEIRWPDADCSGDVFV